MPRFQRELQHMISTKDKLLDSCYPADILWDRFLEDCERAINISELHSNEWSTDDAFLADEERKNKQRPVCSPPLGCFCLFSLINFREHNKESNLVIKVYNKNWRSSRV